MNKTNPDIKIYIACHKPAYVPELKCFRPVQVGAALSDNRLKGMLHDDEGINISEKNRSFCELTAHYWVWKNEEADYYGFFHYRRYLSFAEQEYEEDGWGNIVADRITDDILSEYHLDDKSISELVSQYDIITVRSRDINEHRRLAGEKKVDIYHEYDVSEAQHIKDLDAALKIIERDYPEYKAAADAYMRGDRAYECNMFIMSRQQYKQYCPWLFDILFKLEQLIDFSTYNQEEERVLGFIGERLFGIYYTYIKNDASVRCSELQKILINDTSQPVEITKNDKDAVPVVLAANDAFSPYLSVMIESILANGSEQRQYDLVVLNRDISQKNQSLIRKQAAKYSNCTIRFADVTGYFRNLKLFVDQHLSIETYYRLVVQELMPEYDKILYLDSDMVAEHDVAELYDIDISDCLIAAAKDIDIAGQVKTIDSVREYVCSELGLEDPFNYFQAGALVINLAELRKRTTVSELINIASGNSWRCHDQDVLNMACRDRVYYLPQKWNVVINWVDEPKNRMQLLVKAPSVLYREYAAARNNPYIIHFAGFQKPWKVPDCDMAEHFWKYAKNTPYYEAMLMKNAATKAGRINVKLNDGRLMKIVNSLFPLKTRRRELLKKMVKIIGR